MSYKILFRLFLISIFGALLLGGFAAWQFLEFTYQPNPLVEHQKEKGEKVVEFTVNKGANSQQISQKLYELGLVSDAQKMYWLGRFGKNWKKIKVGEYALSPSQTPAEIFDTITSGISIQRPLTIREGANIYEISEILEQKGFGTQQDILSQLKSTALLVSEMPAFAEKIPENTTLEGFIFPETYFFNKTMNLNDVLKMTLRKFKSVWNTTYNERAKELGFTFYEVIILASMIEKETGATHERPLISSVFHNRLKKKMRLQSDPTTIYGIWERYKGNIRSSDLKENTPYNTYTVPALPIGPIGNPGAEAIKAALYPAESEYLFFVSQNDGTHEFNRNYADHLKAVKRFQLDPKAREGKSWRDLSKKNQGNKEANSL